MPTFPPLVTPPAAPLSLDGLEAYVLPITFGEMAGHGRARTAAREGLTKPADIARAEFGEVERVYVPLWRVEAAGESFHVGLSSMSRRDGRRMLLPNGGYRHADRAVHVLARRHFAIDPSRRVTFALSDARPFGEAPMPEGEVVQPDRTREEAEAEATDRVRRAIAPSSALYASIDVRIKAAVLVWLPLYVVRYRYAGEANDGIASEYHVAISARDGTLVSERRPPVLASLASKLRALF